jgi:CRP/FNR family transcriptional regulator, cyclic AMP receptor protein
MCIASDDISLVLSVQSEVTSRVMKVTASSSNFQTRKPRKKKPAFDARAFLNSAGVARKVVEYPKSKKIYSQGDPAASVMYIQEGAVKLTVLSSTGKQAVVAILGTGDFLGEGVLAGRSMRMATATAVMPTVVLDIDKNEMIRVLHAQHELSDRFIAYMLVRNLRVEEDLIDQLFNSSEKRLARTLLLLAHYGEEARPQKIIPTISQGMLAEMIGTTRSRVSVFMNKFRRLGFIRYNGGLQINSSLLSVVLHE